MLVHLPLYPKAALWNVTNPGTTNYLESGTTHPTGFTPGEGAVLVRVTVLLGGNSTLSVGVTDGTTTAVGALNSGSALGSGNWYTFELEMRGFMSTTANKLTYDFILGTNVTVNALFVSEVGGGSG